MVELFLLERGNQMSLNHNFFLVPSNDLILENDIDIDDISINIYKKNGYSFISIDDNLILYLNDFFKWILCYNPFKKEYNYGINYYGISIFNMDSLEKLYELVTAWISLFNNAPMIFELKGNYVIETNEMGHYEKIKYSKKELLNNLVSFQDLIKKAIVNSMILVHFGI